MERMRFVLALALVLHLSGVPAVGASPCVASGGSGPECCMRHPTHAGAAVGGFCGCQMTPSSGEPSSVVATVLRTDEAMGPMALVGTAPAASLNMPCRGPLVPAVTFDFDSSPPRLTGSGFRC